MHKLTRPLFRSNNLYSLPKKLENVLIFEKLTSFNYYRKQGSLNRHNFGNYDRMVQANIDHEQCVDQVRSILKNYQIRDKNIRKITTRQEGFELLGGTVIRGNNSSGSGATDDILNQRKTDIKLSNSIKNRTKQNENNQSSKNNQRTQWIPDIIISIGGDGTFLRASHLLHKDLNTNNIPILGINSNPNLSEGRLCAGTGQNLSVSDILHDTFTNSSIPVVKRQRIKIEMKSRTESDFYMKDFHHDKIPLEPPKSVVERVRAINDPEAFFQSTLPVMALNDVYIGERAASMVSNIDVSYKRPPHSYRDATQPWVPHHSQKNSGLIISTGTGSTGWSRSANHICPETMKTVVEFLRQEMKVPYKYQEALNTLDYDKLSTEMNSIRTIFDPEDKYLGVTFKDPIDNKISTGNKANFIKVTCLRARSKLKYGMVSIDGTTYHDFSRGSIIECVSHPDYAINCIDVSDY